VPTAPESAARVPIGISVVIPVRDDRPALQSLLAELAPFRGPGFEVLVVDASANASECARSSLAALVDDWCVAAAPCRARQMQHGADQARHPLLWFLHADSSDVTGPATWLQANGQGWGRFDVQLDRSSIMLRLVARSMNARSRLSGICTGDQGIYVEQRLLEAVGGWPDQLLMEDIELTARLRVTQPPRLPARTGVRLTTSARRWQRNGVWRTIFQMWWLRLRYACGADPARLHAVYYPDQVSQ